METPTEYLLVSRCAAGHESRTPLYGPEFAPDGTLIVAGALSDADFCPVCDSPEMTALHYEPAPEPDCTHATSDRVTRTAHGYLGDAPAGTIETLCADCGTVLPEPEALPEYDDDYGPEDVGCECELDWNCHLHRDRLYTAIELQNDAWASMDREVW